MGVWIETANTARQYETSLSHPVWVCGLKLHKTIAISEGWLSHPVWVCGLKPSYIIEMLKATGHTLYGCVD